jgi:hypothetical protein
MQAVWFDRGCPVLDQVRARPTGPAGEVEVQALSGHRRVLLEVCGNYPYDGVADFAAGPEGKQLRLGSILARIGLVWHA